MRLVDADGIEADLRKRFIDINSPYWSADNELASIAMIEYLSKVPTVQERKKGHWIYYGMRFVAPRELRIAYMCSSCKNEILLADEMKYHWKACPICDAMMEEKQNG